MNPIPTNQQCEKTFNEYWLVFLALSICCLIVVLGIWVVQSINKGK